VREQKKLQCVRLNFMTLNERKILRRASIIQTTFPLIKDSPIRRTSTKSIVRDGIPSTKIAQECAGARPDLLNTDNMDVARGKHHNELKMAPMKMTPLHQCILITIKTVPKRNEIQRSHIHLNIFDAVTALTLVRCARATFAKKLISRTNRPGVVQKSC
jgi:hypothetical protein